MRTKKAWLAWLGQIARSRIGWLLALIHLCLVVYCFAQKQSMDSSLSRDSFFANAAGTSFIAGRTVHLYYESTLLQIIMVFDLPGSLLAALALLPFSLVGSFFPKPGLYTESWIAAVGLLMGASAQWWLVGYGMQTLWQRRQRNPDVKLEPQ